jgi:hypothetical protein
MGMTLTKEEHDQWHGKRPALTAKQHDALMKRLGVTKEQDLFRFSLKWTTGVLR